MSFDKECQRQIRLKEAFEGEGLSLIEDPYGLEDRVGMVKTVKVLYDGSTPKGLLRFYIQGERNLKAFHLVDASLMAKYNNVEVEDLQRWETYELSFVIGVRRVGNIGYVISLRLPQK